MNRLLRFSATLSVLPLLMFSPGAFAQRPGPAPSGGGRSGTGTGGMSMEQQSLTLLVNVREPTGSPLDMGAIVKLDSYAGAIHATSTTREAGVATFTDIRPGDYNVEVSAPGYQTATERISVLGGAVAYPVYVYLQQESATKTPNVPGSPAIMSPRLQAEIDKALDKMRRQQYEAARDHLLKAAKMAPGNPDIHYLFGLLEYKLEHFDAARNRFEEAISLYPAHAKSCLALGELLLRTGHAADAAQALEKAYQINGADWRVHLLLAHAYMAQEQYAKAEPHAARSVELNKNDKVNGAAAQLLFGQILAAEDKKQEAIRRYEGVVRNFPNDASAAEAKRRIAELARPVALGAAEQSAVPIVATPNAAARLASAEMLGPATSTNPSTDPAPLDARAIPGGPAAIESDRTPTQTKRVESKAEESLPAIATVTRVWAPPDIDGKEYPLAPDVACHEDEVLRRAQFRSKTQLENFERFSATEHIVHQEVDADGKASAPKERDFTYLVFIQKGRDGAFYLEEERDGGQNLNEFPTHLASTGLVSLGVAVFREDFQRELNYNCEGLGKWRGQPAWQIRFEQRGDAPSRLRTWRNAHGTYRIPLKGRVWVSANTYDVLHLETDLREPQPEIDLKRDHLIVDYGPVQFQHGKTSLWLPWYAELFIEVHGKRYHHRHTLRNYEIFSVDTTDTVSVPDVAAGGETSPK